MTAVAVRLARWAAPPLLLLLGVLVAWQWLTVQFRVPAYRVPSPLLVFQAGWEDRAQLGSAILLTGSAALAGFAVSLGVGFLISLAFSQSAWIRRSCYPYAIFLQTVPIVAIAPLIIMWFGFGFRSVVLVSAIVSLFPVITNGTAGLLAVEPPLLELFRLYRATRGQELWKLRLPHAAPYLVTGARTSSGLAVIGAIVGEFFAGFTSERHGLGYLILQTSGQLKTAELFASVLCSTLLGLVIFGAVNGAGYLILRRWGSGE